MQVKFQFVTFDEVLDKFELDENIYTLELDDDQTQTYELLKEVDLHLYNWFQKADFFINWVKKEVYTEDISKNIAICDIDSISFRRFYFFKVTSGDIHYKYFKKLFDMIEEPDWQDREDLGRQILELLPAKRQNFLLDLKEENQDNLEEDDRKD